MAATGGAKGKRDHNAMLDLSGTRGDEDRIAGKGETGDEEEIAEPDNGEVNFSITERWRVRSERWGEWQAQCLADGKLDSTNLNNLELTCRKDLFVDIDGSDSSPLPPLVQTLQTFRSYTESFKVEIASLSSDIESREKLMVTLASERADLEVELQSLRGESNPLTVDVNDRYAELTADHIESNTDRIKTNTDRIKTNTDRIKTNTDLITLNTELIAIKTNWLKRNSRNVQTFIDNIYEKHVAIRFFFAFLQQIGNESVTTQPGSRHSLDSTRFDKTAVASGSEIESKLDPTPTREFIAELINLVTPRKEAHPACVSEIFHGSLG
jgi:hypothetical protein